MGCVWSQAAVPEPTVHELEQERVWRVHGIQVPVETFITIPNDQIINVVVIDEEKRIPQRVYANDCALLLKLKLTESPDHRVPPPSVTRILFAGTVVNDLDRWIQHGVVDGAELVVDQNGMIGRTIELEVPGYPIIEGKFWEQETARQVVSRMSPQSCKQPFAELLMNQCWCIEQADGTRIPCELEQPLKGTGKLRLTSVENVILMQHATDTAAAPTVHPVTVLSGLPLPPRIQKNYTREELAGHEMLHNAIRRALPSFDWKSLGIAYCQQQAATSAVPINANQLGGLAPLTEGAFVGPATMLNMVVSVCGKEAMRGHFLPDGLVNGAMRWKHSTEDYWLRLNGESPQRWVMTDHPKKDAGMLSDAGTVFYRSQPLPDLQKGQQHQPTVYGWQCSSQFGFNAVLMPEPVLQLAFPREMLQQPMEITEIRFEQ